MNYLIDTNILTRMADPAHAMHQEALDAVTLLIQQGHKLHVVPQNFYEFWVVATRPANVNGLGKTAAEALLDLTNLKGLFLWLDDSPLVYGVWEGLVIGYGNDSRRNGPLAPLARHIYADARASSRAIGPATID
jgi:predicted nucleic acid-binding protein